MSGIFFLYYIGGGKQNGLRHQKDILPLERSGTRGDQYCCPSQLPGIEICDLK